ncbi:response regulator [Thiothrix unzii]|nr:response regulator transcription factor [Thiothrix unzii]
MRILIVDDHPLFREIIKQQTEESYPDACVLEAATVQEAALVLAEYSGFKLILLDISLPGTDGIAGLPLIRSQAPDAKIAILSGSGDTALAHTALAQGANGYISKATGGRELRNALRLILQGEHYISPCILGMQPTPEPTVTQPNPTNVGSTVDEFGMTPRQLAVCRLLMAGLPNKSIARQLDCAEGTIRLHVSAVLRALNARNRTDAVRTAIGLGIA